jgi:hypothetical protein
MIWTMPIATSSRSSYLAILVACMALAGCTRTARSGAPAGRDAAGAPVAAAPTATPTPAPPPAPDAAPVWRGMNLSGWPRMTAVDLGCLVERELAHRDAQFHCGAKPGPSGDPCKNTKAYYAGPVLPAELAAKLHPLAEGVTLAFEHGQLQLITLTFSAPVSEATVRADLGLPAPGAALPDNMSRLWLTDDGKSLMIEGFDHMGAGDVDCKP